MKPLRDEVYVDYKPSKEKVLPSGIIIPGEQTDVEQLELQVLSVGGNCREVQEGDRVIIRKYDLREFDTPDDGIVFLVRESHILAKL